jgi:hypothetical protein
MFNIMGDCFIYIPVSYFARNDRLCPHSRAPGAGLLRTRSRRLSK